ncbi:MAG TPA: hypothetical protein VGO26_09995 [Amnibacterium sp.]|nr:hypothetical protein [Amnibacterium sp.]
MRSRTVDAVVSKHLRLLHHRIRDLQLILTGRGPIIVPTVAEEARFRQELREADLVERGLTELLPSFWPVTCTSSGRVGLVAEARVLVRLRALVATLALGLEQPESEPDEDRLAMATALFRWAEAALLPFEFDENELLPGAALRYERIVAYAMFGQRWGSI